MYASSNAFPLLGFNATKYSHNYYLCMSNYCIKTYDPVFNLQVVFTDTNIK